ncbi:MAG TPA: GNAT family N-acetyltransferase [Miltoncostaeaceae bacterium]|nr:GNAT family N-acetyltransferase [Miltoncostaeaceae bacterium]
MPEDLRDIRPDDLEAVLALNQAWAPAVGDLDADGLRQLVEWSWWAVTTPARDALMIVLPPGLPYASRNYRWVSARWRDMLYIDRIAVAADARRRGTGRQMYAALTARARAAGVGRLTCEVNVRPPNPASLAFHARMGFRRTGIRADPDGRKAVAMLVRTL